MKKGFYPRLAATNLKKNARLYLPYVLASIGTIMMFYIILFLATNSGLPDMSGGDMLSVLLILGTVIIGIFAAIFLFYTNSFVMKRRMKEIGLFNILGMDKLNIAGLIAWETFITSAVSLILGLGLGVVFSKLMHLLLAKIMGFNIGFEFEVSVEGLIITLIYFVLIFFVTLLSNLARMSLSKPVELIRGGEVGEKEPKTKWVLALIGAAALGGGYFMALSVKRPMDALTLFFIAVILVIIGTYCLFTAGSIALLKLLRKNKGYYYQLKHFTSVSGMLYRMKQNAVGLGNICILSTMVLVMLSTTFCMYIGFDDTLRAQCPRNAEIKAVEISEKSSETLLSAVNGKLESEGLEPVSMVHYRYKDIMASRSGDKFVYANSSSAFENGGSIIYFLTLDDYNKLNGKNETLADGEVIIYAPEAGYEYGSIALGQKIFSVKQSVSSCNVESNFAGQYAQLYYIVLPDEDSIKSTYEAFSGGERTFKNLDMYLGFDLDMPLNEQGGLESLLEDVINESSGLEYESMRSGTAAETEQSYFSLYGGLYFLAIFLGALFIMAAVLIIYYKQVSEGYEDKKRFEIMQNVGMSKREVKRTIRSQILTVFFLPLVTSIVHVAFAFKMITKLLTVLGIVNIPLLMMCTGGTVILFAILYSVVYALTAKAYYRIVEA